MIPDWYSSLLASIENAHSSLWSTKANSPTGSEWERELKYQLRAFRSGAVIIEETKPDPGETRERYLQRVAPALEAIPASVAKEDLDAWRDGMRELRIALRSSS